MTDLFSLDAYQFDVPPELIAQVPAEPRDHSRLMIVDRVRGTIDEAIVADLPSFLSPGDMMILNNTRVLHAALQGLVGGKSVHCLLTKPENQTNWWAMAKPGRRLVVGAKVCFPDGLCAEVVEIGSDGQRLLSFSEPLTPERLATVGSVPLPPYIQRVAPTSKDAERYQTIYGERFGSVAAPTAGLHFTSDLFERLSEKGVERSYVTLHVGTGTFLPIRVPDIRQHQMHTEAFEVSEETANRFNSLPPTARRLAVGTTSLRVLESVVDDAGHIKAGSGTTNLFIRPGHHFRAVTTLFTNFHTPGSSLLVLVGTFMGYELMKEAYRKAIERRFRLFSYGDAMLIL
jgi:S-adenosylmethionine:tRNA ribosyltransferase-isomerase